MGSIPDSGKSHMLQGDQAHAPQLLSLRSRARELQLTKATHPRASAVQQDKPPQRAAQIAH